MRTPDFVLNWIKSLGLGCVCCFFCIQAYAEESFYDPSSYQAPLITLTTSVAAELKPAAGLKPVTGDVVLSALSLAGTQYKYGGNTPENGLDCSGFVRYVFKEAVGKILPRRSEEISHVGASIKNHELQPGDLVFFNTLKKAFSHVGIYLGENKFIHAPSSGGEVRIDSMDMQYWKKRFNGARRLIGLPPKD